MLNHPTWQRIGRPLSLSILLAYCAYAAIVVAGYGEDVVAASSRLGMAGWGLVLALSLLNYLLRFGRWHGYIGHLGNRVPIGRQLAYYIAGFAFTTTPGKVGEAVRSLYLRRHAVSYAHSLAALFVERLLDVAAMMLLAITAVWSLSDTRLPAGVAVLLLIALLTLVRGRRLHDALRRLGETGRSPKVRGVAARLSTLLRSAASLLAPSPLYGGLAIGLVAWAAEGVGLWIVLDALGTDMSLYQAIGIYVAATLAGALSFIPGGLGSTEAVMTLLLGLSGVETPDALAATLICRIATLWFAVAIGLAVVAGLETKGIHFSGVGADSGR